MHEGSVLRLNISEYVKAAKKIEDGEARLKENCRKLMLERYSQNSASFNFITTDDNFDDSSLDKYQLTKIVAVNFKGELRVKTIQKMTLHEFYANFNYNRWRRI